MANLPATPQWDPVYQLEVTDIVLGGSGQTSNVQAQALVNRTEFLYNQLAGVNNINIDNVVLSGRVNQNSGQIDYLYATADKIHVFANTVTPFIFSLFTGYSNGIPQTLVKTVTATFEASTSLLPSGANYYVFAEVDGSGNVILNTHPVATTYISSIPYNDNNVLYFRKDLNRFESTNAAGIATVRDIVILGILNKAAGTGALSITKIFNFRTPFYSYSQPVGIIQEFAGETPPIGGWLRCAGQTLSRAQYRELFNEIGTIYGSTSGSDFKLPDTRGLFKRDLDSGAGRDAGRIIGTYQADMMGSHTHTIGQGSDILPLVAEVIGAGDLAIPSAGGSDYSAGQGNNTINNAGGVETRPKNIAFMSYIKI